LGCRNRKRQFDHAIALSCLCLIFQEGKQDGVDLETPPNSKLFDPTFVDTTDIASLAKRRLSLSNKTPVAPQVNVNFAGLAELLQIQKPTVPDTLTHPPAHVLQPKMTLEDFCHSYQLSVGIQIKLDKLGITGPHALRFLSKDDLRHEGELRVGEIAEIRDAEARWLGRQDENGN
jgi:hypothetical protein